MAKRPALTFAAVKADKPGTGGPLPETDNTAAMPEAVAQRDKPKAGRPPKDDGRQFGMTLRMSAELRLALRAAADQDTARASSVVSVHDVILKAVAADLKRRGL